MAVVIRPLCLDDVAALQAIDERAHGEAWSYATFAGQVDDRAYSHLVATTSDGELLGHAATWLDNGSLRVINVATSEASAGQGVASTLLLALFADACSAERVVLEVRPSNRRAQRLYSRFGFAPAGIERSFYDRSDATGSRDAVVMTVSNPDASWQERLTRIATQLEQGAAA